MKLFFATVQQGTITAFLTHTVQMKQGAEVKIRDEDEAS